MIREGNVFLDIKLPQVISSRMPVFYNPDMVVNRDMSLLIVLALVGEGAVVCDPMGASGVRSLRFLLEAGASKVIYNDINLKALEEFKRLIEINCADSSKIELYSEDASLLLRKLKGCDYVDIDPFGSPITFLESGILPVKRSGLLGVSATDTAVLSGTYPLTCIRRYGSKPLLEAEFYHEVGIRILIKKVVEEGAKMDFALIPIFCYSYKHHFKVFFKKELGARRADEVLKNLGYITYCSNCLYREVAHLESMKEFCPICTNKMLYAGPLWIGKLWDEKLVDKVWEVKDMIVLSQNSLKLLKRIKEEAKKQTVGFYTLSAIGERLKVSNLPTLKKIISLTDGTRTHFSGEGFRTLLNHRDLLKLLENIKG